MMLRQMVGQWVRHTASQTLHEVVQEAARGAQYRFGADQPSRERASPCEVLVLFGSGVEAGGTLDLLRDVVSMRCPNFLEHTGRLEERRLALIESGVGWEAAAKATADALALHHPRWVLSAGFASALRGDLGRGHILMADEVVDTRGQRLSVGLHVDRAAAQLSPSVHVGRLLTVDRLVRSKEERRHLASEHAALACDMEAMAIAQSCQQEKVRFLAIRIITDTLDDELPPEIERLLEQKSTAARWGAATGALFKRPSSIKDIWKLKEDALKASDRLARFLAGVIPQLPLDAPPRVEN